LGNPDETALEEENGYKIVPFNELKENHYYIQRLESMLTKVKIFKFYPENENGPAQVEEIIYGYLQLDQNSNNENNKAKQIWKKTKPYKDHNEDNEGSIYYEPVPASSKGGKRKSRKSKKSKKNRKGSRKH
jgi:hypothetical protein